MNFFEAPITDRIFSHVISASLAFVKLL